MIPLLEVVAVAKGFGGGVRILGGTARVAAVRGVSLRVPAGRTLGIVGESGCGKSTLARIMVGLIAPDEGQVILDGRGVDARRDRAAWHRQVQMVFQDPGGSLNPRRTVRQILEAPLLHLLGLDGAARAARVRELMEQVSLRPEFLDRYPHEFSGGQAQRIGIARALAALPRLIVLDEPVSALDVSVQAQVLALLRELQGRLGLTYVFISHDLAVVEALCDRVAVMYQGAVVEEGEARAVLRAPQHAYTRLLLASALTA